MFQTHGAHLPFFSEATHRTSPLSIVAVVRESASVQLIQVLFERVSHLLKEPLCLDIYQEGQAAASLESYLTDLLRSDGGKSILLLPWHIPLSTTRLIEAAKAALGCTTHEAVEERCMAPLRHSGSEFASFGPYGVRNPAADLDRLIALYPGWSRQLTWLCSGANQVLLPWTQQGQEAEKEVSAWVGWQVQAFLQSMTAVLLDDDSVSVPLRLDGATTTGYLTSWICDLVLTLSTTTSTIK